MSSVDEEISRRFAALRSAVPPPREYGDAVLRYARRAAPDVADAVVADTFAVAWRKLGKAPRNPSGGSWRSLGAPSPTTAGANGVAPLRRSPQNESPRPQAPLIEAIDQMPPATPYAGSPWMTTCPVVRGG